MRWNDHSRLEGCHAYLGASKYHWINYDEDKIRSTFENYQATLMGTKLHEYAAKSIELGIKLRQLKKTLNMYVNDAIGFGMRPEQVLCYSENCFGTADAICFDEEKSFLRIHDLKTGVTPAHIEQLYIYEALFCLEYNHKPTDIQSELRIYQNNEIYASIPDPSDIETIMEKIKVFDRIIKEMQERE